MNTFIKELVKSALLIETLGVCLPVDIYGRHLQYIRIRTIDIYISSLFIYKRFTVIQLKTFDRSTRDRPILSWRPHFLVKNGMKNHHIIISKPWPNLEPQLLLLVLEQTNQLDRFVYFKFIKKKK